MTTSNDIKEKCFESIQDLFKKYGIIKAFNIRNNPGYRPSIYIEYSKSVIRYLNLGRITSF